MTGVVIVAFVLVVVGIAGILWKPAAALGITGLLSIIGGIFAMGSVGPSVGISTIIGGIVLVGLSRMLEIAQDAVAELRGLRRDLKQTRPARKVDAT